MTRGTRTRTVSRYGITGLILLILLITTLPATEPRCGTLLWHHGDTLSGHLLDSDGTLLRWQSELFERPFELDIQALSSVQYPADATAVPADLPFRFVTSGNDVLLGTWQGMDGGQLLVASPRHGRLTLDSSQLVGLQRHDRPAAGSVGLGLLSDWKTLHRGRQIGEWSSGVDGRISTQVTGAELYRDMRLTTVSEIDVEFAWSGKPGFLISFAGPEAARLPKEVVKLETWENDLVLQTLGANGDFEVIQTIPEQTQTLALRLQWDPNLGELTVSSSSGQFLGRMKGGPVPGSSLSGLYIQNKGAALDIVRLRASGWNGALIELPEHAVAMRLADASIAAGTIVGFDEKEQAVRLQLASGELRTIALENIDSLDMGHSPDAGRKSSPVRISFLDGTQISGVLQSIDGQVVSVATSYSPQPVRSTLEGVQAIRFTPAPASSLPEEAELDLLHLSETKLHGSLVPSSPDSGAPGWQPIGSRNASPLPANKVWRVIRAYAPRQEPAAERRFADRIYLRNGDAVPCNIHEIDATQIRVDVPLTGSSRIDRTMAVAVAFGTRQDAQSTSFRDPQWVLASGDAPAGGGHFQLESDRELRVTDTALFGYDNIRDADEISFDIQWNMSVPAMVRVNLFTSGPQDMGQSPSVMLYRTSGQQVMIQAVGGVMGGQIRGVTPAQTRDGCSSFCFRLRRDKVVVSEGGKELFALPLERAEQSGKSLSISVQQLQINNMQMMPPGGDEQATVLVTFRNPLIRKAAGDVEELGIDRQSLLRLLTVPRFRRQSPPTEVLVGRNNDVLRGQLLSLDDTQAVFLSRLEEVVIPRERLAGVIWPQTEHAVKETAEADARLARFLFADGSILRMTAEEIVGDAVVGQHPALGRLAVPLPLTREISTGSITDPAQRSRFTDWVLRPAQEPQWAEAGDRGAGGGNGVDSPLLNAAAPQFSVAMLDGTRCRLADLQGKVVILDFWATWCGPCVKAMPDTVRTAGDFGDQVALVAVNQLESAAVVRDFLQARQWQVPVALDTDGAIGRLYHVGSIPQLVLIDRAGMVRHVFVGNRGDLAEQLRRTLAALVGAETRG